MAPRDLSRASHVTRHTSHVTRDPAPEEAALLTVGVRVPARVPTQRPPAVPAHEAARHLPAEKLVNKIFYVSGKDVYEKIR